MNVKLKYGIITAIAIAVINIIVLELIGTENAAVRGVSSILPLAIFGAGLFLGMKENRKVNYNNEINYGQTIFSGLLITLLIAGLLALINMTYYGFINTGYSDIAIKDYQTMAMQMKLKPDVIEKQVVIIKDSYTPINQLKGTFLFFVLLGIVLSAVFSMILRTKDTFTQITKPKQ